MLFLALLALAAPLLAQTRARGILDKSEVPSFPEWPDAYTVRDACHAQWNIWCSAAGGMFSGLFGGAHCSLKHYSVG